MIRTTITAAALAIAGAADAQAVPLPPNFPRAAAVDSFDSMTFVTVGAGLNGGAGPVEWRCSKGAVLICPAGADGINCSRRSRSRTPLPSMVQACRDYGELSVASGAYSYGGPGNAAMASP
jgi:hypothetical protein